MREIKFEKSHLHIMESEILSRLSRVTEFAHLHKRLSFQPIIIVNTTLMFTICQHFNTIDVEVYYTRIGKVVERNNRSEI